MTWLHRTPLRAQAPTPTGKDEPTRETYADYFHRMPCFLSILDQDLRILEANDQFVEAFGEHLGRRCYEICRHRGERCVDCPVERTFFDGHSHVCEEQFMKKNGEEVPLIVYTMPVLDAAGAVQSVMEMAIDITPVRQLQSQLESLGLLIGTVSHSIKGLCTGLDGGIYLVNSGKAQNNTERVDKGWSMVQRNANRLRRLVNNTLYYAKERAPHWETVATVSIPKEVFATLGGKAKRLHIELRDSMNDPIGSFEADQAAICSALVNLLENALDACAADTAKSAHLVTFSIDGDDDFIRFEIEDNGIGMEKETLDKATSLFFSLKGAGGTGIGLYISNKIVATHGGKMEINSTPGQGTRMTIVLPRHGHAKAQDEKPNREQEGT